jgi:flagellar motor protein MotB
VEVVHRLQEIGELDGRNLEARGYGEFRPATPEGMEELENWNRRVDIVIQSESPVAYEALYRVERATGGLDGG